TAVHVLNVDAGAFSGLPTLDEKTLTVERPEQHVVVEAGLRDIPGLTDSRGQEEQLLRPAGDNRGEPFAVGREAVRATFTETDGRRTVGRAHIRGILGAAAVGFLGKVNPFTVGRD